MVEAGDQEMEEEGEEGQEDAEESIFSPDGDGEYSVKEKCLRILFAAMENSSDRKKAAFQAKINDVNKMKLPEDIASQYNDDIEILKKRIEVLQKEREQKVSESRHFWAVMLGSMPRQKIRIRMSKTQTQGGRKMKKCPLAFCPAEVKNLSRHLAVTHKIHDREDRHDIIKKNGERGLGKATPIPQNSSLFLL